MPKLLFALTVFLSAFLLFQIQPIVGKMILPWFGGGSSVWSACMVFFQTALLAGYAYAHWLQDKLTPRRQAFVHSLLLAFSLLALPIAADPSWKGRTLTTPSLGVLALLATTVGLPYLLLSTTGPLIQSWYAHSNRNGAPYRLYALSNLASMLALLSYPVLVEPRLALRAQSVLWSAAYAAFAALCAASAWWAARHDRHEAQQAVEEAPRPAGTRQSLLWIALAACPAILLLSITRHLTQDVAPIPFLWVLPLCIYLLSFILCFDAPRYYYRPAFLLALPVALIMIVRMMYQGGEDIVPGVAWYSLCLFVFCMVCHGELVRRKPHPRQLTFFYLTLSIGGALGGTFVGLLAPALFTGFFEFNLGLALCAALAVIVLWRESRRWQRIATVSAACLYVAWMAPQAWDQVAGYRRVMRNFYSQLRVDQYDEDGVGPVRILWHGRISHGSQGLRPAWRSRPTAYYCPDSGIGRLLAAHPGEPARKIGIVGLGVGTMAAYGRAGDEVRIYEINDQVVDLARDEFSYLKDTPARVSILLGDGRLTLDSEPPQNFDVLAIDAFSGDSVPMHLLTLEAMQGYARHLKPGGVLALHITNTYLDLRPVVSAAASCIGRRACLIENWPGEDDSLCRRSQWAILVPRYASPSYLAGGRFLNPDSTFRPWTDDYSNLYSILR